MRAQTEFLDIEYIDAGPRDAPVVLLLHGWPDDASTWANVSPALNAAGLRTIAPFLRGFGGTKFLDASTPRTGSPGILAHDAVDLLDAVRVDSFFVAGHDWGSNVAEALAVGWSKRAKRIAMLSTPPRLGGLQTPSFAQAQRYWYHWFQATKRGEDAIRKDPKGFARIMWDNWSPLGWYEDATFESVARSWENSDWVDVTLHSYRVRWDEAAPDPRAVPLEATIRTAKQIATPTLYIFGAADGVNPPEFSKDVSAKFSGPFEAIMLENVGHFPTREAPERVAAALVRHFGT